LKSGATFPKKSIPICSNACVTSKKEICEDSWLNRFAGKTLCLRCLDKLSGKPLKGIPLTAPVRWCKHAPTPNHFSRLIDKTRKGLNHYCAFCLELYYFYLSAREGNASVYMTKTRPRTMQFAKILPETFTKTNALMGIQFP
jgi:hypothetical protein